MSALFDTNILIDHLRGSILADRELKSYAEQSISVITWIEVLAGAAANEQATRRYLSSFKILPIDQMTAERSIGVRRDHRIKLPDALIWATAQVHQLLLVTRNTKDFPSGTLGVRIPYRVP